MTIHDLNHLVLPQYYTFFHKLYYQNIVKSCVTKSKKIITVSQFSKKEIVNNLNVPENKIYVTYNGVSDKFDIMKEDAFAAYIKDLYCIPDVFLFCLSNNKPHKNLQKLIEGYCISDINIPLVIASPPSTKLIKIAENHNKKHLIHFIHFIKDEHLPLIYNLASLFIYPSSYEGFGLPPIEAIACGTKVCVANSASLPEVVGSYANMFDPFSSKSIANTLKEAIQNTKYEEPSYVRNKIKERFSWKLMAQKTSGIYESCINGTN